MATYIVLDERVYLTNTEEEIAEARAALVAAKVDVLPEYVGDPDDPSSYKGSSVLFANPRPTRSGTQWSDADYAAKGYGSIKLRLPLDALEMLATKAEREGCSRAQLVDAAVRAYKPAR